MGRLLDVGAKDALVFHPLVLLCRDTARQVCKELAGKGCGISNYSRLRNSLFHISRSFDTDAVVAQIVRPKFILLWGYAKYKGYFIFIPSCTSPSIPLQPEYAPP